jgi:hypothetical protein
MLALTLVILEDGAHPLRAWTSAYGTVSPA